jgi:hypothetical protein
MLTDSSGVTRPAGSAGAPGRPLAFRAQHPEIYHPEITQLHDGGVACRSSDDDEAKAGIRHSLAVLG